MANVFGMDLGGISAPSGINLFSGFGQNLLQAVLWLTIISSLGVIAYFMYLNGKYKFKIHIFENLGGTGYMFTGTDKARLIRLGDGGEMVLKLKKRKVLRTAYGKKMGNNLYWFAVGQDGYWYNVVLGDLDAKKGMLDIEPVDKDMRAFHVAIRRNIQDRYRKQTFMDKFGGWIIAFVFMLATVLAFWFLISKMGDTAGALTTAQQTSIEVMKANKDIIGALNNLLSNSGVR
jgi:hypothetical protein